MHAALLNTGKVLMVAGAGNSQENFDADTFETVLCDPATGDVTHVDTPEDLFCAGHAYLPDGNLLVAGGTSKYEVLADDMENAAGVMTCRTSRPPRTSRWPRARSRLRLGTRVRVHRRRRRCRRAHVITA